MLLNSLDLQQRMETYLSHFCTMRNYLLLRVYLKQGLQTGVCAMLTVKEYKCREYDPVAKLTSMEVTDHKTTGAYGDAIIVLSEELAKLEAEQGLSAEVQEAAEDLVGLADESVTWRLGQAAQARNRALRSQQEDKAEYDTAPNGARINRDEKSAFAQLLEKLNVTKQP